MSLSAELPGKQLEILKETVPQSMRIAVLANPANPEYESAMHNLTGTARALGLQLHVVEVYSPSVVWHARWLWNDPRSN